MDVYLRESGKSGSLNFLPLFPLSVGGLRKICGEVTAALTVTASRTDRMRSPLSPQSAAPAAPGGDTGTRHPDSRCCPGT